MTETTSKNITIRDIPIFSGLADSDLQKIQNITFEKVYQAGDFLFKEGDIGDAFYIIKSGGIDIVKGSADSDSSGEKVLVSLGEGQFFGEMALIEGAPRSAGARATSESKMLVVKKSDFEMLLRLNSFVALKIMSELSSRLHGDEDGSSASSKSDHDGLLIGFFSPKGGCGKTLSAIHLGEAFIRRKSGCKVLLLDLDLQFGDMGTILKAPPKNSIRGLLCENGEDFDESRLDDMIFHHSSGLDVLAAPEKPEDSELIHSKHVKQILPHLRQKYDFIMVDTHCLFEDMTINLLDMADLVFVPFLPILLHVKNLFACLRVMSNLEFDMDKFQLLITRYNLADYPPEEIIPAQAIENQVRGVTELDLKVKFRLSDDAPLMRKCIDEGRTLFDLEKGKDDTTESSLVKEFDLMADCFIKDDLDSNFMEPKLESTSRWFFDF